MDGPLASTLRRYCRSLLCIRSKGAVGVLMRTYSERHHHACAGTRKLKTHTQTHVHTCTHIASMLRHTHKHTYTHTPGPLCLLHCPGLGPRPEQASTQDDTEPCVSVCMVQGHRPFSAASPPIAMTKAAAAAAADENLPPGSFPGMETRMCIRVFVVKCMHNR
jgi:hypothetical protein